MLRAWEEVSLEPGEEASSKPWIRSIWLDRFHSYSAALIDTHLDCTAPY
jgi:hypothetical protein